MPIDAGDLEGLSAETIRQLQLIKNEQVQTTTIAFVPIAFLVYLSILYVSAKTANLLLHRTSRNYRELSSANKKTTAVYVLNVVYTTVALAVQLVSMPALRQEYTKTGLDCVKVSCALISGLYLFELVYRDSMRWPMLAHHFSTIFAIIFVSVTLERTGHPSMIVTGACWLFQATTEQSIFIGLLMYRLRFKASSVTRVLRLAAIQSFIPKFVFALYIIVWYGVKQVHEGHTSLVIAYDVIVVLAISILQMTQVYGSWVVWKIASDVERKYRSTATLSSQSASSAPELGKLDAWPKHSEREDESGAFKTANQSVVDVQSTQVVGHTSDLESRLAGSTSVSSPAISIS